MAETLEQTRQAFLDHLKAIGKKDRTVYTYGKDLDQVMAFFKADKELTKILPVHVAKFLKSDELLKLPGGKDRAKPTVDKTVRVLRMFLVWAKDTGRIDKLPLTKDLPMGRDGKDGKAGKKVDKVSEGDGNEMQKISEGATETPVEPANDDAEVTTDAG